MKQSLVINDVEAIKVLADPLRMQIIHILQRVGLASATSIAEELGESAPKISYHLKLLEKHGIVELRENRTKGNLIENLYAATAREFLIQHEIRQQSPSQYDEAILQVVEQVLSLISADLHELAAPRVKNFESTISYDTYYLSLDEIANLRETVLHELRTHAKHKPEPGRLACSIGFLLLDRSRGYHEQRF